MDITKNFSIEEFKCKDGGSIPETLLHNIVNLANNLQTIRDTINEPLHIVSGYRSPSYNKKVGGAKQSQHLYGKAADITCSLSPAKLKAVILKLIKEGKIQDGGIGTYTNWIHYDIGGVRRWNG